MMILDTNIISFARRGYKNVVYWLDDQEMNNLYISSITVFEIFRGCYLLNAGKKKEKLISDMENFLSLFHGRIIPIDSTIAKKCSMLIVEASKKGQTIHREDTLIAATAQIKNFTVISDDISPFEVTNTKYFNPLTNESSS